MGKIKSNFKIWMARLLIFMLVLSSFNCVLFLLTFAATAESNSGDGFGNWTNYNGIIFGDAVLYESHSGGSLAVKGSIEVNDNSFTIGSTYSSVYNSTQHIGEFKNEGRFPAFLFGGKNINIGSGVSSVDVLGGDIAMTSEMQEVNRNLRAGFTAGTDSGYREVEASEIDSWFNRQYEIVKSTSELFTHANDVEIDVTDFAGGSYRSLGPEYFENKHLTRNGEVYENALFITVRTNSDIDFGQWWPIYAVIHFDINWAIDYDLVVFNFPDAVNVTMSPDTFYMANRTHWPPTVDAWIGQQGMVERLAVAEKVIYNFPKAQSIEATRTLIQGSILAPDASFVGIGSGNEGHIYGHLVVRDYMSQNNFTIHAFSLSNWAYDIVEETIEPEEQTGTVKLWQFLYLNGPGNVPINGGGYVLMKDNDEKYFTGSGFSDDIRDAAVYSPSDSGYVEIEKVPLGSYSLQNISVPGGFSLNNSVPSNSYTYFRFPFEVPSSEDAVEIKRYIEPEKIDVNAVKVDEDTRLGLKGAVFNLIRKEDGYLDRTSMGSFTSDSSGKIEMNALPVGEYYLVEVSTPEGYELLNEGSFNFKIYWDDNDQRLKIEDEDGHPLHGTQSNPIEIENKAGIPENSLTIIKYAYNKDQPDDTSNTLGEAEYELFLKNEDGLWEKVISNALGEALNIKTSSLGYYRIENLFEGSYRLVEKKAPAGFSLLNDSVDEDFPNGYAYEFTFTDIASSYTAYLPNEALTTDITLKTIGMFLEKLIPLPNSTFKLEHLLDDNKTWASVYPSVATDSIGKILFKDLTAGSYRLTQLGSSPGYRKLDPTVITFELQYDSENQPEIDVTYNNAAVTGSSSPVSLKLTDGIEVIVENEAKTKGFSVHKIDGDYSSGQDENGNPVSRITYLEDAVFRLQRMKTGTSEWEDYGGSFVSELQYEMGEPILDSYGNHIAKASFEGGLLYGNYRLIEINTPDGYATGSNVRVTLNDGTQGYQTNQFTVTEDTTGIGETVNHVVSNYIIMKTTDLSFRKVDAEDMGIYLKGAEFAVYSCKKRHVHSELVGENSCWQSNTPLSAKSGVDGVVAFKDLLSGEYRLVEVRAPAGYQLPAGQWVVVVDAFIGDIVFRAIELVSVPAFAKDVENETVKYLLPNQKMNLLPLTGEEGGEYFTLAGLSMIITAFVIGAAALFIFNKKQKTTEKMK